MIANEKTLTLLLVSDIHNAELNLEKLKSWYTNYNTEAFDYVLCLGDVDNLMNTCGVTDIDDVPGKKR